MLCSRLGVSLVGSDIICCLPYCSGWDNALTCWGTTGGQGEGSGLAQLERGPGATHSRGCPSPNTLRDAEAKGVQNQADHKTNESRSITESRELERVVRMSFWPGSERRVHWREDWGRECDCCCHPVRLSPGPRENWITSRAGGRDEGEGEGQRNPSWSSPTLLVPRIGSVHFTALHLLKSYYALRSSSRLTSLCNSPLSLSSYQALWCVRAEALHHKVLCTALAWFLPWKQVTLMYAGPGKSSRNEDSNPVILTFAMAQMVYQTWVLPIWLYAYKQMSVSGKISLTCVNW